MSKPRTDIYYYEQIESASSFKRSNWELVLFGAEELKLEVVLIAEAKLLASEAITAEFYTALRKRHKSGLAIGTSFNLPLLHHIPPLDLTSNRHTNAPTVALSSYLHRDHNNGATTAATTPGRIDGTATPQDPHADRAVASNLVHCRDSTDTIHGARGWEKV